MSKENIVSIQIPEKDVATAVKKLQEVKTLLKPYLIALKPADRQKMLKMGDKTLPFVEKAAEYAQTRKDFTPPYLEIEEFLIDLKAVGDLTQVYREAQQLCKNLDDTILLSGSEAYAEALAYYQAIKQAAKKNIPDAKAIYEDLRQRFDKKAPAGDSSSI
ncbi:MAG: hypothetical protein RIG62_15070 [Cyclobacteriaceae bacterium]